MYTNFHVLQKDSEGHTSVWEIWLNFLFYKTYKPQIKLSLGSIFNSIHVQYFLFLQDFRHTLKLQPAAVAKKERMLCPILNVRKTCWLESTDCTLYTKLFLSQLIYVQDNRTEKRWVRQLILWK